MDPVIEAPLAFKPDPMILEFDKKLQGIFFLTFYVSQSVNMTLKIYFFVCVSYNNEDLTRCCQSY